MKKLFLIVLLLTVSSQLLAGSLYRINGIIDLLPESIVFTTEDCRVFKLDMSRKTAARHNGKTVQIDAMAKDSVSLDTLKVKKIRPFSKRIIIKDPKPYKNYQKPAKLVKANDSEIELKNVRWARMKEKDSAGDTQFIWENVKIRPDLIDKVYFIKKPFAPEWIAAHCLMLYTFKKGGMIDQNGNESRGLVLTIEAYQRKDQKYSLKEGFKDVFGIIWILTTWENYASETCHYEKSGKMVPYQVKFTHKQSKELLIETIKQSVVNRAGEFYHTTRNNCTNNLVVLLDGVAKTKIKFWTIPSMIYNVRATMPVIVPKYLQKKGLLGKECQEVNKTNFFADPSDLFK